MEQPEYSDPQQYVIRVVDSIQSLLLKESEEEMPISIPDYTYTVKVDNTSMSNRVIVDPSTNHLDILVPTGYSVDFVDFNAVHAQVLSYGHTEPFAVSTSEVCAVSVDITKQVTCRWFTLSSDQNDEVPGWPSENYKWDRLPKDPCCSHPEAVLKDPYKVVPCSMAGDMRSCNIYEPTPWVPVEIGHSNKDEQAVDATLEVCRQGYGTLAFRVTSGSTHKDIENLDDWRAYCDTELEGAHAEPVITGTEEPESFIKSILS